MFLLSDELLGKIFLVRFASTAFRLLLWYINPIQFCVFKEGSEEERSLPTTNKNITKEGKDKLFHLSPLHPTNPSQVVIKTFLRNI